MVIAMTLISYEPILRKWFVFIFESYFLFIIWWCICPDWSFDYFHHFIWVLMIISGLWIVFTYTRLSSSKSLQGEIIMSQRRACLLSLRPSQPASNWFVCSVSSGEDWGGLSVWLPRQQTSAGQECEGFHWVKQFFPCNYSQRETVRGRALENLNI